MDRVSKSIEDLAPEAEFLLCCGSVSSAKTINERARTLLRQGLKWDVLLSAAGTHGMEALLLEKLKELCAPEMPAEVMVSLQKAVSRRLRVTLTSVAELFKLIREFRSREIDVIPFKGPALAIQAYGSLALRPYSDLDILVREVDVPRATEVLVAFGYKARYTLSPWQSKAMLRFACELPFHRAGSDSSTEGGRLDSHVDLHWNLFPPGFSIRLPNEVYWSRRTQVAIASRTLETFASEDLLLYLCVHGFAHHWNRLEWIASVARLISRHPQLDWALLHGEAEKVGCVRILHLGLSLAKRWMHAEVPVYHVDAACEASFLRFQARLVRQLSAVGGEVARTPDTRGLSFDFDGQDDFRRRIIHTCKRALIPSIEDVEQVRFPPSLFSLYYMLRPVRLLMRQLFNSRANATARNKARQTNVAPDAGG